MVLTGSAETKTNNVGSMKIPQEIHLQKSCISSLPPPPPPPPHTHTHYLQVIHIAGPFINALGPEGFILSLKFGKGRTCYITYAK